jgi:arylsulfatase A-like enzyme
MIRDTGSLAENHRGASGDFDQLIELDRNGKDTTARVFQAATQWLKREAAHDRFVLIIDCHGAHRPWYPPESRDDADTDLEEIDADFEADLAAAECGETVSRPASASSESKIVADQARQTYSEVVAHLDSDVGSFLDFLAGRPEWERSLVTITSDCGAILEAQDAVIAVRDVLSEDRVHVPLLVRVPGAHDPSSRSSALVQTLDLMPTVFDALDVENPSGVHGQSLLPIIRLQARSVRDHALMAATGRACGIRTSAWNLIQPTADGSESPAEPQLFIRPDDRWNRNDVAKQFSDVAEQLKVTLRQHLVVS